MSNCSVIRNAENKIVSVTTPTGVPSQAYEKIVSNLFGVDAETSLDIFGATQQEGGVTSTDVYEVSQEPRVYYQAEGIGLFEDMEVALINNGDSLSVFNVGTKDVDGVFKPVATFNAQSSPEAQSLVKQVQEGLLSAERVMLPNGDIRFKGKGINPTTILGTARFAKENIQNETNSVVTVFEDGTLSIEYDTALIEVKLSNGSISSLTPQQALQEIKSGKVFENQADVLIESTGILTKPLVLPSNESSQLAEIRKSGLSPLAYNKQLTQFMNGLGFSLTTMEAYKEGYRNRHGSDVTVGGLIDLAEGVIAISEGVGAEAVLAEEVSHLAVEAYNDTESITSALMEVVNTQEYNEWAETYREKYSQQYETPLQVEEAVRKEILGKVIANSLMKGEQIKTPMGQTIWDRFVGYLRSIFNPRNKSNLDRIVANISDDVRNGRMENYSATKLQGKQGVFYSVEKSDPIQDSIQKAYKTFGLLNKALSDAKDTPITPTKASLAGSVELSIVDKISAIHDLASTMSTSVDYLDTKIQSNNIGEPLTATDVTRFDTLRNNIKPELEAYQGYLNILSRQGFNPELKSMIGAVESEIQVALNKLGVFSTKINTNLDEAIDAEITNLQKELNLSDEATQEFRQKADSVKKDIGWATRIFGLASKNSNPFILMMSRLVMKMNSAIASRFTNSANKIIDEYVEKGQHKYQQNILDKKNGKSTGYVIHEIDRAKYDAEKEAFEKETLGSILGLTSEEVDTVLKKKTSFEALGTDDNISTFNRAIESWVEERDGKYKDSFIQDQKELYDQVEVSEYTKATIRGERQTIRQLHKKIMDENGKVDRSKMTLEDKIVEAKELRKLRTMQTGVDATGEFFEGVERKKWSELTGVEKALLPKFTRTQEFKDFIESYEGNFLMLNGKVTKENLTQDGLYAIDRANMNLYRRMKAGSNTGITSPLTEYIDKIKEFEDSGDFIGAYNWAVENGALRYTEAYYEAMEGNVSYMEEAQRRVNEIEDDSKREVKQQLLNSIKNSSKKRAEILRGYQDTRDSSQVIASDMSTHLKDEVRRLDAEIDANRKLLGFRDIELGESEVSTIKTVTQDFHNEATEQRISRYDLALKNMTESKALRVQNFRKYLEDWFGDESSVKVEKSFENVIERYIEQELFTVDVDYLESLTDPQEIEVFYNNRVNELSTLYAQENVASYYQTFQLDSRADVISEIQSGNLKISAMMENPSLVEEQFPATKYFEISPDYAWSENLNTESIYSEDYNEDLGYVQPKKSMYKNQEWYDRYGFTDDDLRNNTDRTQLTPRKNVEEFRYWANMVNMKREINKNYSDDSGYLYLRPQISTTNFEKLTKSRSVSQVRANAKDIIRDTFQDRVDELEHGEVIDGMQLNSMGIKVPPKYFTKRLEDPQMLTDNIMSSYLMMLQESIRYSERMKAMTKGSLLLRKMESEDYVKSGVLRGRNLITEKGQVSNSYRMASEIMDSQFYGIKQTTRAEMNAFGKTIDLTRTVGNFQRMSSFTNLAFNPIISTTSYLTGLYNNTVDTMVGQHYSAKSVKDATASFYLDMPQILMEGGKINTKSRMKRLMEGFGLRSLNDRIEESGSSMASRMLEDLPYMTDQLGNLPVIPRILYNVLYDNKLVDGRFMTHQQFVVYQKNKNPKIKSGEIKVMWQNNSNTLFDMIDSKSDSLRFTKEAEARFSTKEEADAEFTRIREYVSGKARQLAQDVDGVLNDQDMVAAKRNVWLNLLMQHKGWLPINITRMFKERHLNLMNGAYEEGHYRTAINLAGEIGKALLDKNFTLRGVFNDLSLNQKQNMKRVGIEMVAMMSMYLIMMSLKAADDDDDPWIEDAARYIGYRVYGEMKSGNVLGAKHSIMETLEAPITALGTFKKFDDLAGQISSLDFEKAKSTAISVTPGIKTYNKFQDLDKTTKDYLFFNKNLLGEFQDK